MVAAALAVVAGGAAAAVAGADGRHGDSHRTHTRVFGAEGATRTMGWRIGVEGPEAIVQQLAIVVSDHDLRLEPRRPIARLSAAELDAIDDEQCARREAERIVAILSASARLLLGSREPLRVLYVNEERRRPAPDAGEGEPAVDVVRPPPLDAWAQSSLFQSLRLALADPAMARALQLRDVSHPDWAAMLEIYRVIEAAAGGRTAVQQISGVPDAVLLRFLHTAEREAPPPAARAVRRAGRRAAPMPIAEAVAVVDRLLMTWLGSAVRHRPSQPPGASTPRSRHGRIDPSARVRSEVSRWPAGPST